MRAARHGPLYRVMIRRSDWTKLNAGRSIGFNYWSPRVGFIDPDAAEVLAWLFKCATRWRSGMEPKPHSVSRFFTDAELRELSEIST